MIYKKRFISFILLLTLSYTLQAQSAFRSPRTLFYEAKTRVEIQMQSHYRRLLQGPLDLGGSYLIGNKIIGVGYEIPLYLSSWKANSIEEFAKTIAYVPASLENLPVFSKPYLIPQGFKLISIFKSELDEAFYFQFRKEKEDEQRPATRLGIVAKKIGENYLTLSFEAPEESFIAGERWVLRLIETAVEPLDGFVTPFKAILPYLSTSMELLPSSDPLYQDFDFQEGYGSNLIFYRLEDKDNTVYLLGSVHAGIPDFFPLPNEAISAFESCKNLVFEAVPEGNTLWELRNHNASLEKYKTGSNLLSYISPQRLNEISRFISAHIFSIPQDQLIYQKPWVLYTFVSSLLSKESGVKANYGIENYFLSIKKSWQEVKGLEELKYHLGVLDRISADYWLDELMALDGDEALQDLLLTMDKWKEGDLDFFNEMVIEEIGTKHPTYFKFMLEERNEIMANSIIEFLNGDEDTFILAGTAHFAGPENIIELLKERGYEAIRIKKLPTPLKNF